MHLNLFQAKQLQSRVLFGCACMLSLATLPILANTLNTEGVLDAMESELNRSMEILSEEPEPPFYLSYEITDTSQAQISASFGEVTRESQNANTFFDIDLRVGELTLDNTHNQRQFSPSITLGSLSNTEAIQNTLWLLTDRTYKAATENLVRVRTSDEISIKDDESPDFAPAVEVSHTEKPTRSRFDGEKWKKRLTHVSGVFRGHDLLYSGSASASIQNSTRYFVNTEKSRIHSEETTLSVTLRASTRAEDGAILRLADLFHSFTDDGLPNEKELTKAAESLVTNLIALRNSKKVDPYTGPAILSGQASGVLFHEILGHRLEGHRLKRSTDAQTFKDMLGQSVLPPTMSVVFDPTLKNLHDVDLLGYYQYDNEGVAGHRVEVIKNGVLKEFLFGRSTLKDFPHSNGHGRKAIGYHPIARQSNLVVQVQDPYTPEELEQQLIEMLKERDLEFGLFFDDIEGGYTITSRALPNSFTVQPVIVYKIYQDGSRELVRGVELIGTPLAVFDSIIAAADDSAVFNGLCGAESGSVPVSAISPSILVGQIEVQRSLQATSILPILPPPEA